MTNSIPITPTTKASNKQSSADIQQNNSGNALGQPPSLIAATTYPTSSGYFSPGRSANAQQKLNLLEALDHYRKPEAKEVPINVKLSKHLGPEFNYRMFSTIWGDNKFWQVRAMLKGLQTGTTTAQDLVRFKAEILLLASDTFRLPVLYKSSLGPQHDQTFDPFTSGPNAQGEFSHPDIGTNIKIEIFHQVVDNGSAAGHQVLP